MFSHQTLKLLLRSWRITKMVLPVISLFGAYWAVTVVKAKSQAPTRYAETFPVPQDIREESGVKEPTPVEKPTPPVRMTPERTRSPEVNAVLSRLNPIQTTPPEVASQDSGGQPTSSPAVVPLQTPPVKPGTQEGPKSLAHLGNVELPVSIQPLEAEAAEVKQAREAFDRYRKTEGWWDRMALVRTPGRASGLAHRYYDEQKRSDPVTGKLIGATRFTMGGETFVQLAFVSASRWSNTSRVNFSLSDKGEPLIDWESFVGYGDVEWDKFVTSRSDQPTLMRGYIAIDDYYNFEFTDRDRFLCTKLTSPDGKVTLFGYCERNSAAGEAVTKMSNQLATMLLDGPLPVTGLGTTIPVILEMAFPTKAQTDKSVNILRIISNRWVLTHSEQAELVESLDSKAAKVESTVVKK